MRLTPSAGLWLCVVFSSGSVALAKCDPTGDPDKTDIASARAAVAANCDCAAAASHGAYVSCAALQANAVLVNVSCAGAVKRCAAHSTCGKPAGAVTCSVTRSTGTKCKIKRDAGHCRAPPGGTACVGSYTSCCDATGCVTTTTTTSTTTTTGPTSCGNNVIDPGEVCDGTALGPCATPPFGGGFCGSPGFSNACRCCSNGGPYTALIGCCDPSAILVPQGPPEGALCIPTRCDAPFTCGGNQCQPDGSCCTVLGGTCRWTLGFGLTLNPCCPGLACLGDGLYGHTCCLGGGGACTSAADCCSRSCGPSGTCDGCRFAGSACGSPSDCCSLSCTAGLCDACGITGTPCVPGSLCCSGVCNATTGQCD